MAHFIELHWDMVKVDTGLLSVLFWAGRQAKSHFCLPLPALQLVAAPELVLQRVLAHCRLSPTAELSTLFPKVRGKGLWGRCKAPPPTQARRRLLCPPLWTHLISVVFCSFR